MQFIKSVHAHCDVPCGIYETDTMTHAVETCIRMIGKIAELGELDSVEKHNTFVRCVMTKEKHAQRVKKELFVLWGDYFKSEHLDKYPDLHDKIWQTAKQASTVKQTVSLDSANTLMTMVKEIEQIFQETKAH